MPRPTTNPPGELLYEALGPQAHDEQARDDWPTLVLAGAIGSMFEKLWGIAQENWDTAFDADEAPPEALPWLAQFAGVRFQSGWTTEQQRLALSNPQGFARGTDAALAAAAQPLLTGTRTVIIRNREGGDPNVIGVITNDSETPDPDAVEAALLRAKHWGLLLNYQSLTGRDYFDLAGDYATYSDLGAEGLTYADVAAEAP